ncbi:MAG: FkbM family methyltransferase [Pikeienuella sp.]
MLTTADRLLTTLTPAFYRSLWLVFRSVKPSRLMETEELVLDLLVYRNREAVDVGANMGSYTLRLMSLCPKVYAFEPNADCADRLERFAGSRLIFSRAALSDRDGTAMLNAPVKDGVTLAALGTLEAIGSEKAGSGSAQETRSQEVALDRLDRLADRDIGFVKIDVEGHEVNVLKGGEALISKARPRVLVEIEERHRAGAMTEATAFFERHGYTGFFILNGTCRPLSDFSADMQPVAELSRPVSRREMRYANNFIFCPSAQDAATLTGKIEARLRA